jgi:hypothetical protein
MLEWTHRVRCCLVFGLAISCSGTNPTSVADSGVQSLGGSGGSSANATAAGGSAGSSTVSLGGNLGSGGTHVESGTGGNAGSGSNPTCLLPGHPTQKFLELQILGSDFGAHDGRTIYVIARTGSTGVLGCNFVTIRNGSFSISLPSGFERNSNEQVLWFVDVDADGICNAALGDHVGLVALDPLDPATTDPIVVTLSDSQATGVPGDPSACTGQIPLAEMSDLRIDGTGFGEHEGARIHLVTATLHNGSVFASGSASIVNGTFTMAFSHAYQDFTYQEVDWYIDTDGDGHCTTGTDHTGSMLTNADRPTDNSPVQVPITDTHQQSNATGSDVCASVNACPPEP